MKLSEVKRIGDLAGALQFDAEDLVVADVRSDVMSGMDDPALNGREWAQLVCHNVEQLEALKSVGQEALAPEVKVSVAEYDGRDLSGMVGEVLDSSKLKVRLKSDWDRFKGVQYVYHV